MERQRELERQRERERREREERERLERERRERLERERLERERIERDRLHRIERERLERLERERVERERLDRQRLERERLERDRRNLKRPAASFERGDAQKQVGYWQEPKRAAVGEGRPRDFFSGGINERDTRRDRADVSSERRDSRGSHREEGRQAAGGGRERDVRRTEEWSRADERRLKKDERERRSDDGHRARDKPHDHSRGARDRDLRDSRGNPENKAWAAGADLSGANVGVLGAGIDPQKSLSILLERAGVGGILGSGPAAQGHNVRGNLSKSMEEPGWRPPDPRDSRPPIPQAERGAGFTHNTSGLTDIRSAHVDARFGSLAMDPSHRAVGLAGGVDSSKPPARDWRDTHGGNLTSRDRDALAARERERPRGRGAETKQGAPRPEAIYDARDTRAPISRDSIPPRGAWGNGMDSRQAANPALGMSNTGRPAVDDRSRAAVPTRDSAPPPWNQPGGSLVTPVGRAAYNGSTVPGPERRHPVAADARYEPYKAAPRVGMMRRY